MPEVVSVAVERAADLVYAELAAPETADLRDRLEEIEEELATLRRVAARSGRRQELSRVVAELETERTRLSGARTGSDRPAEIPPEILRATIEARVREVRSAFEASVQDRREAFRALLGNRRMRVGPDPERGFRVEGVFALALEVPNARPLEGAGRRQSVVAGGATSGTSRSS
ncbi:MAG TPA: hypothetical protein VKM54_25410 [Myxococcota bacterium]|nr:hypothetical protein [Myxococcota bacterium]